jgi:hypothetical protein
MDLWQNFLWEFLGKQHLIVEAGPILPAFTGNCCYARNDCFSTAINVCKQLESVGRMEGKHDIGFQKISNQARRFKLAAGQG